ncbi:hypothetical protein AAVH_06759 [Aphelenchoides avenae]|nr:hypothetical protein AAVH_06759 [Aphelenchus avenae]
MTVHKSIPGLLALVAVASCALDVNVTAAETVRRVKDAHQRRLFRLVDLQRLPEDRLRHLKGRHVLHRRTVKSVALGANRPATITVPAATLAAIQDLVVATQDSQATVQDMRATIMELEAQDMRATIVELEGQDMKAMIMELEAQDMMATTTAATLAAIQDLEADIQDSVEATQDSQATAQDTTATTTELVVQVMRVTITALLEDIQAFLDMTEVTTVMIMAQWEELLAVTQVSAEDILDLVAATQATAQGTKGTITDPLDMTTAPLEVTTDTITALEATLAASAADTLATPEVIRDTEAIAVTKQCLMT